MSQKAYPAVTLKEVHDLENKFPDKVIPVEFKLERNGSVSISTSDYVTLMMSAKTYTTGSGKNLKAYNIVHTSAGFVNVCQKKSGAFAEWICDPFQIKAVVIDDKNSYYAELDSGRKTCRIPFESFLPNKIYTDLFNKGIAVSVQNRNHEILSQHLQWLLGKFEPQDAKMILGWKIKENQLTWSGTNAEPPLLQYQLSLTSEAEYINQLNKLIKKCHALQFVLCASASSTLLAYLSMTEKVPVAPFGVSLVGTSSTGKTTALQLAASLYSSPEDEAVYSGFYGTSNALIHMLGRHQGVPLCYDESTISNNMDKGNFVYAFVEGKSKLRLDQQSQLKERDKWLCTCLFSSETHLVDIAKHDNLGLGVRIINLDDYTYTKNSRHADEIKTFAGTNYGIVGKLISEYLLHSDSKKALANYEIIKQAISENPKLEKCSLTDRLILNYALILHTAHILQNIGISVDIEALQNICVEVHNKLSESAEIGKNTIHAIFNYIASHPQLQGIKWTTTQSGKPLKVAINEITFGEILEKCGISDMKGAIKHLDKEKYLIRQSTDRIKSKLNIDGISCYAYQFNIAKVNEAFGTEQAETFSNVKKHSIYEVVTGQTLDITNNEEAIIHDGNYKIKSEKAATCGKAFLL